MKKKVLGLRQINVMNLSFARGGGQPWLTRVGPGSPEWNPRNKEGRESKKGLCYATVKIFININYFLFYCVVSDISPPESFKIKQPFSMTFVAMDKNLWRKSNLPLKRPNFAILVF